MRRTGSPLASLPTRNRGPALYPIRRLAIEDPASASTPRTLRDAALGSPQWGVPMTTHDLVIRGGNCAGQEIYNNGVATGALPGRLIRHAG